MDMGGWDVIYASSVARLNAVLAQSSQQLIPSFSYSDETGVSFSGNFGPWNIRPGGSANRINLQVPISSGQLNAPGLDAISLNGVEPVLNLALTLVEGTSSGVQDLKFDIQSTATTPGPAGDGQIYIANADESGLLNQRDPTGMAANILQVNLPKCFLENAAKISFVFASVFTDPQNETWLKPTATGVSYFGSTDGTIQAVAIKTLTQSPWSAANLSTAVDPSLLSGGNSLFYSLSQAVFMKNLLLPAIPGAIGNGVTADTFQFNGPTDPSQQNACSITNTGSFNTQSVEHAGTHYYPEIDSFKVTINNNQIITTASGKFDVTGLAGAWVGFDNLQVINEIYFDPSTQTVKFQLVSQTQPSVNKHIPWEYWLLAIGALIGLIVIAIINIVVITIDNAVQSALTGEGNLSIASIPVDSAVWTGLSTFRITQTDLESAFVIRGQDPSQNAS